jgi:hypothetical protein
MTRLPADAPVGRDLMARSVCGYDAGGDRRMTVSTNPTEREARPATVPSWLRIAAFVLLLAALWLVALFAMMAIAPLPEGASWELLVAVLPAAIIAALLARTRSIRILLASIIVAWLLAAPALYLGSQLGGWPWRRETARSTMTAAPAAATAPAPAPSAAPARPSGAPPQSLPDFPWPPPSASASYVLPRTLFDAKATVGQVTSAIIAALERSGYVERSFFRTGDNGVALVTRLERINDDGSPPRETERWPGAKSQGSGLDLAAMLRGLFYVDRGHYRLIVFILQDRPFTQSSEQVTETEARRWLRSGANVLPREIADRPFGDGNCTALIYEFTSDGTAVKVVESQLTGRQHLEKSGVLAVLEKAK